MKTGYAFGEHIKTEKIPARGWSAFGRKKIDYGDKPAKAGGRGFLLPTALILSLVLLISKLFYLQVIKGNDFRVLSDSNRIRTRIIHAPRGVIFDRNSVPLVLNKPGFRKILKRTQQCETLTLDKPENEKMKKCLVEEAIPLSREQALPLIAKNDKSLEIDSLREYTYKDSLSHVLGYTGQISKEEIESTQFKEYQGTDWIGKSGIERQYESVLRGTDGKQLVEVDVMGKEVRPLGVSDPISGRDITLTIDAKIQRAAYDATKNVKRGAVIASTPTGEILAMVSRPSFDPNLFTLDKTYNTATDSAHKSVQDILSDTNSQPLLNRAIAGTYPPGSTFKIVTAASGLTGKTIDENYTIRDSGVIKVGEFSFANWYFTNYGKTESGELNVIRSLARSNDIFFYKLAEKVGVEALSATAKKFGAGSKSGIDLGAEAKGLVPTKKWKEEVIGESWYLGDTYHYGIGQGFLLATPLQVHEWASIIAGGGNLYKPHLLKGESVKRDGGSILDSKSIGLIRQGMIESCSPGGVAWPLFKFKVKNGNLKVDGKNVLEVKEASGSAKAKDFREVRVACKTGTAQHGGEETLPHAWITLFAPAYDPEIVITVLNEESGEGSNEAAPIAKKILEAYFSSK